MLKKLIKYDFKSTSRYLIPLYLALIAVTILTKGIISLNIYDGTLSFIPEVIILTYEIILAISIIATYIVQALRYYTNMVTDEGYQTFTLPVKTSYLTISKLVTAVSWNLISIVLVMMSAGVVFYSQGNKEAFIDSVKFQLNELMEVYSLNPAIAIGIFLVMLLIIFATYNLFIYTAIALGQLFAKNKLAGSFIAGIIIYMVIQFIMLIVFLPTAIILENQLVEGSYEFMSWFIGICMAFQILLIVIMYRVINHVFNRKLNLE